MRLLAALIAAAAAVAAHAAGGRAAAPVVLELYTSQGCSSCPPADALLNELAQRDGVIALSLHVDYWDYLGWKDEFGRPEHSARQRAYAKAARARTLYTPELVVQGQDRLKGHDAKGAIADIEELAEAPPTATLTLARDGRSLRLHLAPTGAAVGAADIQLVHYIPNRTVAIAAGENAGRDITYTNIVTDWRKVGTWDGTGPLDLTLDDVADGPLAVIVQRAQMGPVLTAAKLP